MSDTDKTEKKQNWFARHKVLSVILGIILLFIIIQAASGGGKSNTASSDNSSSKKDSAAATAKIGETARDGKFEFVVKSFKCGESEVGTNQYLTKTAQGQYCLLDVTVKNIGDEKQSLFSANQQLFDSANKKYSADDTATMYAAPQGSTWYSDINPGNSVEGTIVFDVPKDVTPNVAELHDSAYSNGVKVNLQ